jgi:hypothetical protein
MAMTPVLPAPHQSARLNSHSTTDMKLLDAAKKLEATFLAEMLKSAGCALALARLPLSPQCPLRHLTRRQSRHACHQGKAPQQFCSFAHGRSRPNHCLNRHVSLQIGLAHKSSDILRLQAKTRKLH